MPLDASDGRVGRLVDVRVGNGLPLVGRILDVAGPAAADGWWRRLACMNECENGATYCDRRAERG